MTCARALRLAWVVCLATPALLANSVLAQPKILFVGDSITAGIGATDWKEGGFVAQIGQRFPELVVANAGCNASTIRDWTSSKPADICFLGNAWQLQAVPELPAHITHVMLGTNGARGILEHFGTLLAWEYELRLRWMIEQAPGLVLISAPPRSPFNASNSIDDRLRTYRDIISAVVAEFPNAEQGIDTYSLLEPLTDFQDDTHPNDRGHTKLADALERRMLQLLPRGFLSSCKNPRACERFALLPQLERLRKRLIPPGRRPRED